MSAGIGWALWHHSKLYGSQFKEQVPGWLQEIELPKRLKLIKLACSLRWRLPAQVLHDGLTEPGCSKSKRS